MKECLITETEEQGLILTVLDSELADMLDDFLTENCYAFYNIKPEKDRVEFYFGQVGCPEKLKAIIDRFSNTP